jgi:GNAT superfamily N-acetyltransferase
MRIRESVEGDAVAVTALWTEAYADAGPEGRREPYALQEYFAVAARAAVSVAEDEDGELVAVVALFPPGAVGRSVAGPGEAELARLAVAGPAWRRGIGRELVERCAAQAGASRPRRSRSGAVPTRSTATVCTGRSATAGCRSATARTATAAAGCSGSTFDRFSTVPPAPRVGWPP